jgi:hypothetical protein
MTSKRGSYHQAKKAGQSKPTSPATTSPNCRNPEKACY